MRQCELLAGMKKEKNVATGRQRGAAKREKAPRPADMLLNLVLIACVMALALVSFFALLDLVQFAAAYVIITTNDSPVSSRYALATVRNFFLLAGGAVMVGIVIYLLDYGMKRWRTFGMRRLYLRALAVELAIIGLQLVIAG